MEDDREGIESPSLIEPKPVYTHNIPASVMDMQFIDKDKLGVCLSNGTFTVMQYWPGYKVSPLLIQSILKSPKCSFSHIVNKFREQTTSI